MERREAALNAADQSLSRNECLLLLPRRILLKQRVCTSAPAHQESQMYVVFCLLSGASFLKAGYVDMKTTVCPRKNAPPHSRN